MRDQHQPEAAEQREPYEPPAISVHELTLVTQGGSPGAFDSGAEDTEDPRSI